MEIARSQAAFRNPSESHIAPTAFPTASRGIVQTAGAKWTQPTSAMRTCRWEGFGSPLNLTGTDDLRGAVGGAQMGANYQSRSFACTTLSSGAACVVGIEVDVMGSGQKNSVSSALGLTFDDKITWLATARARAG